MVVSADDEETDIITTPTYADVLNRTRYTNLTASLPVATIIDNIYTLWKSDPMDPDINPVGPLQKGILDASYNAIETAKKLKDYANESTNGSYQIKDSWAFVAKRHILYPVEAYNYDEETDYMFCYVDKNTSNTTPQSFGDVCVAPNSVLIIRLTSWEGMRVFSFNLDANNVQARCSMSEGLFSFVFRTPPDSYFVTETPEGSDGFDFNGTSTTNTTRFLPVLNYTSNAIDDGWLTELYTNYQSYYEQFATDPNTGQLRHLNDLECVFGNYLRFNYYENLAKFHSSPWILTSGYCNIQYPNAYNYSIQRNTTNNINNVIDPEYPPVYIVPNTSPFNSGKTINQTTINNYNDYGMTYNSDTSSFELDPTVLAAALAAEIDPTFAGLFGGVFSAQPAIGLGFDTPDLELGSNYIDLIDDAVDLIIENSQNQGGGGSSWQPPSYPAVNTSAYIPATYPTIPTNTYPSDYLPAMADTVNDGWDLFDSLGILSFLIPIVIFCAVWRFTGG